MIRCSPIFEYSSNVLVLISLFGGISAIFFSLVAIFQYDIKKVIAYSTCSQLGYMFFSCGFSNYQVAIYHLFNHAFFKALLFLSAGSIIHALYDEQDMRRMGALVNFLPFTYFCISLGSLAIMGFPFLTGFYSKDLILELTYSRFIIDGGYIYMLGIISAFFTAVYSARLILFIFFSKPNMFRVLVCEIIDSSFYMTFSMFFLCLASIYIGYLFSDALCGLGTFYWSNSLFLLPLNFSYIDGIFVHSFVKNLPFFVSFLGVVFSFLVFYIINDDFFRDLMVYKWFLFVFNFISPFFYYAGFFNVVYNDIFLGIYKFSYELNTKIIDKGFLEFFGPFGFYNFFFFFGFLSKKMIPYVLFLLIGLFFFCLVFLFVLFMIFHGIFLAFVYDYFSLVFMVFLMVCFHIKFYAR